MTLREKIRMKFSSKKSVALGALVAALLAAGCASSSSNNNNAPAPGQAPPVSSWGGALAASVGMPGDDEVRVQRFEWTDTHRNRPVPVKLFLPKESARVPLVISHGIGGSREGYSYIGKYLAANGIATLHVQHAGSDRALWFGNPLMMVARLAGAAQADEAIARAKDISFALDQAFADASLVKEFDPERIAITGHSYGANTALLVSGAQVQQDDRALNFTEPRIKASVIISAPPFYGQGDAKQILGNIRVPTLHITSLGDDITIPGYRSGVDDRLNVYDAVAHETKAQKLLAVFKAGSHSMFTDRLGTGGVEHNPKVKRATRELILTFLKNHFSNARSDATTMTEWASKHAELIAQTKLQ
jgi:dienelactone hydrolase